MMPEEQHAEESAGLDLPANRVRELLFKRLCTDSDFEAFCSDYFPRTSCLFAGGMDRQAKVTLLFQRESASAVLARLHEKSALPEMPSPAATVTPGFLLSRVKHRRLIQRVAMPVVFIAGLVLGIYQLHWFLLHVTPFGRHRSGIILYKPFVTWPATARLGSTLCAALEGGEKAPIRCASTLPWLESATLAWSAAKVGALVAAILDSDRMLRVSILVEEARRPFLPLRELPRLPIAGEGEVQSAARALNLLRRYLRGSQEDCSAPIVLKGIEPHYALIGILLRFRCQGGRALDEDGGSDEYQSALSEVSRSLCAGDAPSAGLPCMLSKYFLAIDCPEDKESSACQHEGDGLLQQLIDHSSDLLLGQLARIERSRRICERSPKEALALLDWLFSHTPEADVCKRAALAPMLFCVRLSLSKDDPLHAALKARQQELNRALTGCPRASGPALAEIGVLELKRGFWEEAAKTLLQAQKLAPSTRTALALAEANLLLGRPKETVRLLSVSHAEPALATHVAFVLWLAKPGPAAMDELQRQYRKVPANHRAVFDATETLNMLACTRAGPASEPCRLLGLMRNRKWKDAGANPPDQLVGEL